MFNVKLKRFTFYVLRFTFYVLRFNNVLRFNPRPAGGGGGGAFQDNSTTAEHPHIFKNSEALCIG